MIREIGLFKLKSDTKQAAIELFEHYAAYKRTRPGCRLATVDLVVNDPSLPYLDQQVILVYAEYDDLKSLAASAQALQKHFNISQLPFENFLVGPPIYNIFQA